MKKLLCVTGVLLAVVVCGCQRGAAAPKDRRAAATVHRQQFTWDKDLRPMVVLPTRQQTASQKPAGETGEGETPPTAQAAEPIREQPRAMDTRTRPVVFDELRTPPRRTDVFLTGRSPGVQPDLVAVSEAGLSKLVMVYPREDYGIVQIDKVMPSEVRANKSFEYVIKVTNLTDAMLSDLVITEELPASFAFESADPTPSLDGRKLSWQLDSLGPRGSKQMRVSGLAKETITIEHCTYVTHTIRGCATIKVVEPTLQLMTVAPADALLCEQIPVDFVVTNSGTGSAQNVQIVTALPAGLQTSDGRDKVVLDVGALASGQSRQISIKLRAAKTGVYTYKAVAISAANIRAESASITTAVRQPLLAITKTGPARQYLGRPITYEIAVTNKGDGQAVGTVVEDIVPPGVTSTEATAGAKLVGSKLVWEIGTLEPNSTQKLRISYIPTNAGDVVSSTTATAHCADGVVASAKTTVTGIAAVRLEVADLEDPVEVGANTTYEIAVTNQGSAADSNIRIVCALDDRLRYVSSSGATAGSLMGRTVSFAPLRTLEPKAKATWRVVVAGVRAGDIRFKVTMSSDQLAIPVEATEATHVYE